MVKFNVTMFLKKRDLFGCDEIAHKVGDIIPRFQENGKKLQSVSMSEWLTANKEKIEKILGISFVNPQLLYQAFMHRSYVHEAKEEISEHNERLEFLGDSVLGLIMAGYLFRKYPKASEGWLSPMRARLVEASACLLFLQKLHLEEFILLGKGESKSNGKGRISIYSDLFEAIVGAIYLDSGLEEATSFIEKNFEEEIQSIIEKPSSNFKAILQDHFQRKHQKQPMYKILHEEGPDHAKSFLVGVFIEEECIGKGEGFSKKEAEQKAAEDALLQLKKKDLP